MIKTRIFEECGRTTTLEEVRDWPTVLMWRSFQFGIGGLCFIDDRML